MCPQPDCVGGFVGASGENNDIRAERRREFHAHVAEPAQAHDADLLSRSNFGSAQRSIRRNPGTE